MHTYATDSKERVRIIAWLAVISVGASYGLSRGLAAMNIPTSQWLDAPSTMGIFWALYGIFDRVAWRWPLLHRIRVVRVPVLDGNWQGHVRSSFDQHATEREVGVHIRQTWTKLSLALESAQSRSRSLAGALEIHQEDEPLLSYLYRNEPKADAPKSMHTHYGTARLVLRASDTLDGDYYSGRDRQNQGAIHLKKTEWGFSPGKAAPAPRPPIKPDYP